MPTWSRVSELQESITSLLCVGQSIFPRALPMKAGTQVLLPKNSLLMRDSFILQWHRGNVCAPLKVQSCSTGLDFIRFHIKEHNFTNYKLVNSMNKTVTMGGPIASDEFIQ